MWQKQCRLTLVDKFYGGGGGGSTEAAMTQPGDVKPFYAVQTGQVNKFGKNQGPLKAAEAGALDFWQKLYSGLPSIWNPSAAELRDVSQESRAIGSAQGTVRDPGQIGREVLAQDQYRINRAGQLSGLVTGGLNQLLGVENSKVGNFVAAMSPMIQLLLGNQQASIANAQIAAQQQAAGSSKLGSSVGGAISAIGPILGAAFSDERIKTKIKDTGEKTPDGIPIKTFQYKTDPRKKRYAGVMAQDVEEVFPWAVITDKLSGLKMVTSGFGPREVT